MKPLDSPIRAFFCYAHADYWLIDTMKSTWATLEKNYGFEHFIDNHTHTGEDWNEDILKHLAAADVVFVFISEKSLNSKYIREKEYPLIRRKMADGTIDVISIYVEKCIWQDALGSSIKVIPFIHGHGAKAVKSFRTRQDGINLVRQAIFDKLRAKKRWPTYTPYRTKQNTAFEPPKNYAPPTQNSKKPQFLPFILFLSLIFGAWTYFSNSDKKNAGIELNPLPSTYDPKGSEDPVQYNGGNEPEPQPSIPSNPEPIKNQRSIICGSLPDIKSECYSGLKNQNQSIRDKYRSIRPIGMGFSVARTFERQKKRWVVLDTQGFAVSEHIFSHKDRVFSIEIFCNDRAGVWRKEKNGDWCKIGYLDVKGEFFEGE
jgi:TIR domain